MGLFDDQNLLLLPWRLERKTLNVKIKRLKCPERKKRRRRYLEVKENDDKAINIRKKNSLRVHDRIEDLKWSRKISIPD